MESCIETLKKIEDVVAEFYALMGKDAERIEREDKIGSSDSMKTALDAIRENNRLLRIGIVGRVKAGKSSLLNALLFEGQNVLPKAATPMTAALTTLTYGETLSAEVDFFTEADLENIKNKSMEYEEKLKKKTAQHLEELKARDAKRGGKSDNTEALREKAERRAKQDLKDDQVLSACHDQWERIKASGIQPEDLKQASSITAGNYEELKSNLLNYVSADAKFMPFTKIVKVSLPLEILKDVSIVDTPGINDPVESRVERTRDLLKYCDVILVVSPAGQFMSEQDTDLMDRIGSKEGVRELYVVASQIDTQLFGSEKKTANGRLHDALASITGKLENHLHKTVSELKKNNGEIGATFDQLIDDTEGRVIHSSGICRTIMEYQGRAEEMDDGTRHVWNKLTEEYSDYFSKTDSTLSEASLKQLANITSLHEIISVVRGKKEQILKQKSVDFLTAKQKGVEDYKTQLLAAAEAVADKLRNSDLKDIEEKKQFITQIISKSSIAVDEKFSDLIEMLDSGITETIQKEIEAQYKKSVKDVKDEEKTETTTEMRKKDGLVAWFARLFGGGYENVSVTQTTIRAGALSRAFEDFIDRTEPIFEGTIKTYVMNWRKQALSQITTTLTNTAGKNTADNAHLDAYLISRAVRDAVGKLDTSGVQYNETLPSNLKKSGKLRGEEAEEYMEAVLNQLRKMKRGIKSITDDYISGLVKKLKMCKISDIIFSKYQDELEKLKEDLQNYEITMSELKRFEKELQNV